MEACVRARVRVCVCMKHRRERVRLEEEERGVCRGGWREWEKEGGGEKKKKTV